jgi:hypothetical protein
LTKPSRSRRPPCGSAWAGCRADSCSLPIQPNNGDGSIIFITTYKIKPFLSKAETKELMSVFARVGAGPGTTAHYIAADGSHGVVIGEVDDLEPGYANQQNYTEWVEYDTTPVLKVEQAVPHIMAPLS